MNPRKTSPQKPQRAPQRGQKPGPARKGSAQPPDEEREIEVEEIELNRALRQAGRPIPGTLGGDFKV